MDQGSVTSPRKQFYIVGLIIAFFTVLIFLPAIAAYIPIEKAKWYVAAAKNAFEKAKQPDDEFIQQAKSLLAKARETDPEIVTNRDYVFYKIAVTSKLGLEDAIDEAKDLPPDQQYFVVSQFVEILMSKDRYKEAIELIVKFYPDAPSRGPNLNNTFAYAAALANDSLDEAETAIDYALSKEQTAAYLDTKAWVLFGQQRYDEALFLMQQAIIDRYNETAEMLRKEDMSIFMSKEKKLIGFIRDLQRGDVLSYFSVSDLVPAIVSATEKAASIKLSNQDKTDTDTTQAEVSSTDAVLELDDDAKQIFADQPDDSTETTDADAVDSPETSDTSDSSSKLTETKTDSVDQDANAGDIESKSKNLLRRMKANLKPLPIPTEIELIAKQLLREFAVYRFHRAQILGQLGHDQVAELEYEFLRANGFDDFDKLK